MHNSNKRLLIVDAYTGNISYLIRKFPYASITVIKPDNPKAKQNEHGHQMAECALSACPHLELFICHHESDWLKTRVELGRCNVSISMGYDFTDMEKRFGSGIGALMNDMLREEREKVYTVDPELLKGGHFFFSAGNSDESTRARPELEADLASPQDRWSKVSDNVHLIGACSYKGVPSLFSSDDSEGGVDVAYVGESVIVFSPSRYERVSIAGTSPACAFAAGHMTRLGEQNPKEYWKKHCNIAEGWTRGNRHRKMGYGSMLYKDFMPLP